MYQEYIYFISDDFRKNISIVIIFIEKNERLSLGLCMH